ncbi:Ribosomal protein S27 [Spironucleus salmonicida]|uniref:Ribosomal protein S27 n=1 Tax=Spironucleus salmonicida TaxID=348837 RepID=A0A9P8RXR1_9EUKA|nr:Ribosomal protein S27 [Spironucleus salmonicida]
MKLFVQYPTETLAVTVDENMSVKQYQELVGAVAFMFAGKMLQTAATLRTIPEDSTIIAVTPVDGAGKDKKRKKKVKKTPKHKSHVDKKVKLAILKLYSVKGDTVDSLREYCKRCGAGVRLSNHKDRKHCGKCGSNGK